MHNTFRSLIVLTACLLGAALTSGCAGPAPQDDVVDQDVDIPDESTGVDTVAELVDAIDYGEIVIRVLPPDSFCGCSGPMKFQTEETLCGWHFSDVFQFRVQALHTALGYEGVEGIAQVKLYQHWPANPEGDTKIRTLSMPDSDGLFTFQVERSDLALATAPDGTYWLRLEVVSAILGPDGLSITKDFVIPFDVDTTGPTLHVIAPGDGQKLSSSATVVFTAEEGANQSGIAVLQVFIQKGQGTWEPLDISLPVTTPNGKETYVGTLDLKDFDTQDTTLRIQGTDCLGNMSHEDVEIRIIAIPRFVTPATLTGSPGPDQALPTFGRIKAVQGDGLTGLDPDEPPLDLLVTSDLGAYIAWGHPDGSFDAPALVVNEPDVVDARLRDVTGDAVPDLVLLSQEANQEELVVTLWIQDTAPGTVLKGTRTFQLKEKRNVQIAANKLDIADVTGNGRPDILSVSSEENESLFVLHHTGKTAGVQGDPPAYLDYPLSFTGVAGGVAIDHLDANGDGAMDVVIGREGSDAVTTFLNDGTGEFDIGVDSLLGFGVGTTKLMVTNLHSNDSVLDLIVFNSDLSALVMVENVGNGYFSFPGIPIGKDLAWWGNENTGSQIPAMAVEYDDVLEAGRMVMVEKEIGGFVRGYFDDDDDLDIALTTPDDKLVRIYKGVPDTSNPSKIFEGMFRQDRFVNAGTGPSSITSGDFNGDGMDDIAVVNQGTAGITVLLSEDGDYHATLELPMPLGPVWDGGQLVPSRALVADFGQPLQNGTSVPDSLEDLLVITEPVKQTWLFDPLLEGEDASEEDISISLFLTYLGLGQPSGRDFSFVKSAVSHRMNADISGAVVGNFDGDYFPDVAISTATDPATAEAGGNFDILRGAHSPLVSDPTSDGASLEFGRIAGRFWPLGGFIGPRSPTDLGAALLNGADERDDLILVANEQGDISDPAEYQWARATSYINRYDNDWNSCEATYNQVSFKCCQPQDPALPCGPTVQDVCIFGEKGACEGLWTGINEVGYDPIKVVVDYISYDALTNQPDPVPDVLVLNRGSGNFSYFIGTQTNDSYAFNTLIDQPNLYAVGSNPVDMDVGDLDGDLIPDVVVALQNSLVIAYGQDDPIHHFMTEKPLEKGPDSEDMAPTGVLMADVNLDGFMDIVTSSKSKSRIWIYISAGDRDYLGPYPFECGKDPVDVVEIDYNGTDCPHLAVVNAGSRSVSLLRNERCD